MPAEQPSCMTAYLPHMGGTWHTSSLSLRASLRGRFYYPTLQVRKLRPSEVSLHTALPDAETHMLLSQPTVWPHLGPHAHSHTAL